MIADALATVREWHADEGWGRVAVTDSGDVVWTHFSVVEGRSFASLHVGEQVRVSYRTGSDVGEPQAERVVPVGEVEGVDAPLPPGAAYRSSLTIVDDPE